MLMEKLGEGDDEDEWSIVYHHKLFPLNKVASAISLPHSAFARGVLNRGFDVLQLIIAVSGRPDI